MNNKQQKSTVSKETGLTPIQEQACMLLASGASITEVADKLSLNRGTIYKWQKQVPFMCYFNRQCTDNRGNLLTGLYGLTDEALKAIKDCLHSSNEATRLKAAIWLTEKICDMPIGQTDVVTALKKECTHNTLIDENWGNVLDKKEFAQKMSYWGIECDDD